jgi:tight adherence protein C
MSDGEMSLLSSLLRSSTLFGVLASVGSLSYALGGLRASPPPRLGLNGVERRRALVESSIWRLVEPLVRWSGRRLDVVLSESQRSRLRHKIMLAGDIAGLVPGELVALSLGAALLGVALGGLYAVQHDLGPLAIGAGLLAGALLPFLKLDEVSQERRRRAQLGLPPLIDLLALALSAGLDFPGALRQVVSRSSTPRDAFVVELKLVLHQLETGKTRSEALRLFAQRLPNAAVQEFVAAVVLAEQTGSPLAEVLQTQAKVFRQRRSEEAEEASARASVKMLLPLIMAFGSMILLLAAPIFMELSSKLRATIDG